MGLVPLYKKEENVTLCLYMHLLEERPCKHLERRLLPTSQKESPHQTANLSATCPCTSSLQN